MAFLGSARRVMPDQAAGATSLEAFDRELDYVSRTLVRMGAPRGDLEDLLQDVFVVLHRNWPSLDKTRPLRPWLFGVAFRVVRTHRRRRSREPAHDDLDPLDVAPDPEGWVQGHQSLALLMQALERVPIPRRSAMILHYLEGMEVAAVARELSISKFGVYTRLFKGRKELAAALRVLSHEGPR